MQDNSKETMQAIYQYVLDNIDPELKNNITVNLKGFSNDGNFDVNSIINSVIVEFGDNNFKERGCVLGRVYLNFRFTDTKEQILDEEENYWNKYFLEVDFKWESIPFNTYWGTLKLVESEENLFRYFDFVKKLAQFGIEIQNKFTEPVYCKISTKAEREEQERLAAKAQRKFDVMYIQELIKKYKLLKKFKVGDTKQLKLQTCISYGNHEITAATGKVFYVVVSKTEGANSKTLVFTRTK